MLLKASALGPDAASQAFLMVLSATDMMIEFMLGYDMERQEWWSIIMTSFEVPEPMKLVQDLFGLCLI